MTTVLEHVSLHERLSVMPAGWRLLRELEAIDPSTLDGCDLPAYAQAVHKMASYLGALELVGVEQIARCVGIGAGRNDKPVEFARQEIGQVYHWTDANAGQQLKFALDLHRLPAVMDAMRSGDLDYSRALRIVKATSSVEDDQMARRIADVVLPSAPHQTTAHIARRLYRLIAKLDPKAAKKRTEKKKQDRRVSAKSDCDGLGSIHVTGLPVDQAASAIERVDSLARGARNDGDARTLDQLRADIAVGLLDGTWDGARPIHRSGVIELTVPLTTLMDLQDLPGEVSGWGAVCADIARQTAERMLRTEVKPTTRFTVYDDDGNIVADGSTRRRPPSPMAASVRAGINQCIFPGCWRPARQCDLDHKQRIVDGGETSTDNLHPLCRRHHRAKDEGGWRYDVLDNGVYQWISPLGQVVIEDRRRFRDDVDDTVLTGIVNGAAGGPDTSVPDPIEDSADELIEALVDVLADASDEDGPMTSIGPREGAVPGAPSSDAPDAVADESAGLRANQRGRDGDGLVDR